MAPEPPRIKPPEQLSRRMAAYPRRDTRPELALRRELHARGLRYRVQLPVPGNARRRIDVAFTRAKVAVFVDGCFWHGCPDHGTRPSANAAWWDWKIARNQARDRDTDAHLSSQGWTVVRVWEHEAALTAADRVAAMVAARRAGPASSEAAGKLQPCRSRTSTSSQGSAASTPS